MADMTQARARELFNYDPETGQLTWRKRAASEFTDEAHAVTWNKRFAGQEVGGISKLHGYRRIRLLDREWKAHRIIWLMVHGNWPEEIDHINGVRDDNRLCNLREVDHAENMRNLALNGLNKSGTAGVSYAPRDEAWRATANLAGEFIHLGNFKTFEEACAARKAAEKVMGYHPNHGRRTSDRRRQA